MERYSKNRQAILDCLRSTKTHPTAEWVYSQLRASCPSVSLGTVYRNLCQLKESGAIRSMGVIAGEEHFDGDLRPHSHIICRVCGKIEDLPIAGPLDGMIRDLETESGFSDMSAVFTGVCSDHRKPQN